jgi:hypothetical protein
MNWIAYFRAPSFLLQPEVSRPSRRDLPSFGTYQDLAEGLLYRDRRLLPEGSLLKGKGR